MLNSPTLPLGTEVNHVLCKALGEDMLLLLLLSRFSHVRLCATP